VTARSPSEHRWSTSAQQILDGTHTGKMAIETSIKRTDRLAFLQGKRAQCVKQFWVKGLESDQTEVPCLPGGVMQTQIAGEPIRLHSLRALRNAKTRRTPADRQPPENRFIRKITSVRGLDHTDHAVSNRAGHEITVHDHETSCGVSHLGNQRTFEGLPVTAERAERRVRHLIRAISSQFDTWDSGAQLAQPLRIDVGNHDLHAFPQTHQSAISGGRPGGDIDQVHGPVASVSDAHRVLDTVDKTRHFERRSLHQYRIRVEKFNRQVTLESHRWCLGQRPGSGEEPESMEELSKIVRFKGGIGLHGHTPCQETRPVHTRRPVVRNGRILLDTPTRLPTVHPMQDDPEQEPADPAERDEEGRTLWFDKAEGLEPGAPDPGCLHDWQHLGFADNENEDLACHKCGRLWEVPEETREALLTVWQSSLMALRRIERKMNRQAALLETMTGTVHCHWCDLWKEAGDGMVTIGRRSACPEHVGQMLDSLADIDEDDMDEVRAWLDTLRSENPDNAYAVWLQEKALIECDDIPEDPDTAERTGEREVRTEGAWATLLGLEETSTVNQLVHSLCRLLELPVPVSRPGRTLLLGAIARAVRAAEIRSLLDENILGEVLQEIVPTGNRGRATIVLDLYRGEIPEDGTLSGDMADDLVEALVVRMAAELGNLLR